MLLKPVAVILTAIAYFANACAFAFAMGFVHTLVVAPRLGATVAILLEVPKHRIAPPGHVGRGPGVVYEYAGLLLPARCPNQFGVTKANPDEAVHAVTALGAAADKPVLPKRQINIHHLKVACDQIAWLAFGGGSKCDYRKVRIRQYITPISGIRDSIDLTKLALAETLLEMNLIATRNE